ncbi:MAG: methyltransferase domain-containing protein [Geminicoccaceae bacterium]
MDLSRRSRLPERMDDPSTSDEAYARCLADLAEVNRLTSTHRPTLAWLGHMTQSRNLDRSIRILDVACGAGDLLRAIHDWAGKRNLPVLLEGIDLNPRSASVAQRLTPPGMEIRYRTGDVFSYAPNPRPNLIVTSQFTHHLDDEQVVALLRWLDAQAIDGWHIADLHRHPIAYWGFGLLATCARWHPIVRHDGMVSVARSFTRAEWAELLRNAGTTAEIRWWSGFRWSIARALPPECTRSEPWARSSR